MPLTTTGAGGFLFVSTTLDPSNKGPGASTGAGNLVFTTTVGGGNVRSLKSFSSGKHMCEITFAGTPTGTFGICDSTWSLTAGYMSTTHSAGFKSNGQYLGDSRSTGDGTLSGAQTIAIEVDADAGNIWYHTTRGRYGPFALTITTNFPTAPYYFAAESDVDNTASGWTFNFGSSPWVLTPQAGFVGL